jgi:hypothetical protein
LSAGGSRVLDQLFPRLLDEMAADGAIVCNDGNLARFSLRVGAREFNRSGRFVDPAAVRLFLVSRQFLESHVRQRVHFIDNVRFLEGHDVVEPVASGPRRITGVRVVDRETNAETVLDSALMVDAMGRSARSSAFLAALGYERPVEHNAPAHGTYASQLLRIPEGLINDKLTFVFPERHRPVGGALSAYENSTWMLTVGCVAEQEPPDDLAGVIAMLAQFAAPELVAAVREAEPLGEVFPGGRVISVGGSSARSPSESVRSGDRTRPTIATCSRRTAGVRCRSDWPTGASTRR